MIGVLVSNRRGFHQQGSKGTSKETSIVVIDGDGGGDSRLLIPKEMESMGRSMIHDVHTTLIMLQQHMPIVQKYSNSN